MKTTKPPTKSIKKQQGFFSNKGGMLLFKGIGWIFSLILKNSAMKREAKETEKNTNSTEDQTEK